MQRGQQPRHHHEPVEAPERRRCRDEHQLDGEHRGIAGTQPRAGRAIEAAPRADGPGEKDPGQRPGRAGREPGDEVGAGVARRRRARPIQVRHQPSRQEHLAGPEADQHRVAPFDDHRQPPGGGGMAGSAPEAGEECNAGRRRAEPRGRRHHTAPPGSRCDHAQSEHPQHPGVAIVRFADHGRQGAAGLGQRHVGHQRGLGPQRHHRTEQRHRRAGTQRPSHTPDAMGGRRRAPTLQPGAGQRAQHQREAEVHQTRGRDLQRLQGCVSHHLTVKPSSPLVRWPSRPIADHCAL